MNKTNSLTQPSSDATQKDPSHLKKPRGQSRDPPADSNPDETDKTAQPLTTLKVSSHFDYSNLGLFFGARQTSVKSPNEGMNAKFPSQKLSNEILSGKEGNFKPHQLQQQQNSQFPFTRDYSNLEELVEDTTIIPSSTGIVGGDQGLSGKKESQAAAAEEKMLSTFFKIPMGNSSGNKDEISMMNKMEQEIAEDISKLGIINMEDEEQENPELIFRGDMGNLRDSSVKVAGSGSYAKNNNLKVLERIKNKALAAAQRSYNASDMKNLEFSGGMVNGGVQQQLENRTNNNAGPNKLTKVAVSPIIFQYQYKDIYNEASNDQDNFIKKLFETPVRDNSEDIPLDKSKEISQEDLNPPKLLTEKTGSKMTNRQAIGEFNPDSSKGTRRKLHNLTLMSNDSTLDSENFTLPHDHQNNSFSTRFSGADGSLNNSGKADFGSPAKIESARLSTDVYSIQQQLQKSMSMTGMMPSHQGQPQQMLNLSQSYMTNMSFYGGGGGYASSNNSDRSNNHSFNDEYLNTFTSPQGNHQEQNFLNQSFNGPSSPNMMEQFFIAPQSMGDSAFRNQGESDFNNMMGHPGMNSSFPGTPQQQQGGGKNNNPHGSNGDSSNTKNFSSKNKRRSHEGDDANQYEIDLDKVEANGRTTLMVRNIPNKYDLTLILQTIDKNHKGKFDFFYLPIDFSNRCNFGYAFINFTKTKYIKDFYNEFNGKKWEKFNSEKICEIKYGRIQGYQALMQHFQYSRVMNQQDKKLRPYVPSKYGLPNKQKIEELVRQQKLASVKNGKEMDPVRSYK